MVLPHARERSALPLCALLLALLALPLAAQPRIAILTGQSDMQYHDWRKTTPFLQHTLEDAGMQVTVITEAPTDLTRFDAALVNYNGPRWPAAAEQLLEAFVKSGKGVASFHGVTYGPWCGTKPAGPPWNAWIDMLGARWAPENIGHKARGEFRVVVRVSEITQGIAAGFTTDDELYHRIALAPGAEILATAFDNASAGGTGRDEPMAWTNRYGQGRVFHTTLGHDVRALDRPEVKSLLVRGVQWTAIINPK